MKAIIKNPYSEIDTHVEVDIPHIPRKLENIEDVYEELKYWPAESRPTTVCRFFTMETSKIDGKTPVLTPISYRLVTSTHVGMDGVITRTFATSKTAESIFHDMKSNKTFPTGANVVILPYEDVYDLMKNPILSAGKTHDVPYETASNYQKYASKVSPLI
jgi:hypothetical protein